MKTCIICREQKLDDEFNEEHIIQDSIGGRIKIYDVCTECNSQLGNKIDIHLTNNLISELIRFDLGLKGKSGKLPNPFKEGTLSGEKEKRVICNDKLEPKLRPHIKDKKEENTIEIIAEDEKEAFAIAKKKLKRIGIENISDEDIRKRIKNRRQESFNPTVEYEKTIDVGLIELAIIKIAYEIAYYCLGKEYLNDVQGKKLSTILLDYIKDNKLDDISSVKGFIPNSLTSGIPKEKIATLFNISISDVDLTNLHCIFLDVRENKLYCNVSIFDSFRYWVLVSEDVDKYLNKNKFIIIYASTGQIIEL